MLAYRKNCKVCNAARENPKLLRRIFASSYYIPHSKDSLRMIVADGRRDNPESFSYIALLNHCKKHQHLNAEDYNRKMLQIQAKKAEDSIMADKFEAQQAQDAVINRAMEQLESGELKINANHLLRAAKDKQDAQAKRGDQQLRVMEMIAFYQSGEDKLGSDRIYDRRRITVETYDPSVPITEYTDSGSD